MPCSTFKESSNMPRRRGVSCFKSYLIQTPANCGQRSSHAPTNQCLSRIGFLPKKATANTQTWRTVCTRDHHCDLHDLKPSSLGDISFSHWQRPTNHKLLQVGDIGQVMGILTNHSNPGWCSRWIHRQSKCIPFFNLPWGSTGWVPDPISPTWRRGEAMDVDWRNPAFHPWSL